MKKIERKEKFSQEDAIRTGLLLFSPRFDLTAHCLFRFIQDDMHRQHELLKKYEANFTIKNENPTHESLYRLRLFFKRKESMFPIIVSF